MDTYPLTRVGYSYYYVIDEQEQGIGRFLFCSVGYLPESLIKSFPDDAYVQYMVEIGAFKRYESYEEVANYYGWPNNTYLPPTSVSFIWRL